MATASDGSVYVFGGYENGQGKSNDLFKLDVATGEWHLIEPLGTLRPGARNQHAMTAVGTDIYLFGGQRPLGVVDSEDSGKECDRWMGRGQTETEGRAQ